MTVTLKQCILSVILISLFGCCENACPNNCVCETVNSGWIKLKCGSTTGIKQLEDIDFTDLRSKIIQLNLSLNHLQNISSIDLPNLKKLDLSKNKLVWLGLDVFKGVPSLRQLDLSNNSLKSLKLDYFKDLNHLKQLDVSQNNLICDCDLVSVSEWLHNKSVKLLSNPKCTLPRSTKTQNLKKLKINVRDLCNQNIEIKDEKKIEKKKTAVKIWPIENQIVFEGDSLKLNCLLSGFSDLPEIKEDNIDSKLSWSLSGRDVNLQFSDVVVVNKYSDAAELANSTLYISHLNKNHEGDWKCVVKSSSGNQTKSVTVIVITEDTKYCPLIVTSDNKGLYMWPKTIAGHTVDLPCQGSSSDIQPLAFHTCTNTGNWEHMNTSICPYISEITKILQQFSKVNLTLAKVFESAVHLEKNFTSNVKMLRDKMDIVFIARTVINYLEFLTKEKQLGYVLSAIVANLMNVKSSLLEEANIYDGSCEKLVKSVEKISEQSPITLVKYATQEFKLKQDNFPGLTCTWYTSPSRQTEPSIHCSQANGSWPLVSPDKLIEASVQIPESLFHQVQHQSGLIVSQRLLMSLYTDSRLFPVHQSNKIRIHTAVVGAKFVNSLVGNLSYPVYVMLRGSTTGVARPAVWDDSMNGGRGGWSTAGCRLSLSLNDNFMFHCDRLGYYGVLQDAPPDQDVVESWNVPGALFRLSHPATYVGGFVLFTCLLTATVTYLLCYGSIQMAKKTKHSLVNTWIAMSLLCFMYTFGIFQTEDHKICQGIGIIIHYLTLSSLLWMCVTVNNMYRRVGKTRVDAILSEDALESDPPIQKPILGLYLVGWGVALIVCGISGAINMREYASHSLCFLTLIPALSALYVPAAILVLFMTVLFLLIRCAVRDSDAVGQLSEGTQGTENVDLDMLEPNATMSGGVSVKSTSTGSSVVEDSEHAPMVQLRAHIIVLILFLLTWIFGAVTTVRPSSIYFLYGEDVFSIIYALLSSILGIFILFFYCVARNDVRTELSENTCWTKRKQLCCRPRGVCDANQPLAVANQVSVETQITSRSSSRNSSHTKSASHKSNNLVGAVGLNKTSDDVKTLKGENVDLVVLHRQQYRSNNTVPVYELTPMNGAEYFYNPHQSGVARKFFKKQKRNMMKHNNLGTRRQLEVSSSLNYRSNSDVGSGLFGTRSKVNNTNIHVEKIKECRHTNLNMLMDDDDCLSEKMEIPVGRFRKLHKPKINTVPIECPIQEQETRTVSQQCSLEYSSETLSDRSKLEPNIYVNPVENLLYDQNVETNRAVSSSVNKIDEVCSQDKKLPRKPRRHTLNERHLCEATKRFWSDE